MIGDRVMSSYLGFPLVIGDSAVEVLNPLTGRAMVRLGSVKQARLFVRGYRRAERQEVSR